MFIWLNFEHEQKINHETKLKLKNEISDVLLELIKLGFGTNDKIIKSSDVEKLRKIPDENEIIRVYKSS